MSSWIASRNITKKYNSPPISEWKFSIEVVNNNSNKDIILNSPLNQFDKYKISTNYNFDVNYFKNFNDETQVLNENQAYNYFIYYALPNMKSFDDYDYIVEKNLCILKY